MSLSVCPSCARHRRIHDDACPFCGERTLSPEVARPLRSGATRAALVFGGVALGMGCFSKGDVYGAPPPPDAGTKMESSPVPAYGGPPLFELPDGARTFDPPTPRPAVAPSASGSPLGPPKPQATAKPPAR